MVTSAILRYVYHMVVDSHCYDDDVVSSCCGLRTVITPTLLFRAIGCSIYIYLSIIPCDDENALLWVILQTSTAAA